MVLEQSTVAVLVGRDVLVWCVFPLVNFMSERENRDRWTGVLSRWKQVMSESVQERFR